MRKCIVNCSDEAYDLRLAPSADPDIAGVGVLIGFMLSAAMTLVLVIIYYLLLEWHHTKNVVDHAWIKFVTPKSWRNLSPQAQKDWTLAITSALLTYSDSQIITGIAILLAGYCQLSCGISVYHWQVVVNLAWFSSLTHVASLTVLRKYFRERPVLAYCRLAAMGINLVLLGVASGPANYNAPSDKILDFPTVDNAYPEARFYAFPAKCFFEYNDKGFEFNYVMITTSLGFLLISYIARVIQISTRLSELTDKWLRHKIGNWLENKHQSAADFPDPTPNSGQRKFWCFWKKFLLLSYVVLKALYEVGHSMLWEIVWLAAGLAWGTIKMVVRRTDLSLDEESAWGFGQFLAVFVSILPIWTIFQGIYENRQVETIATQPTRDNPGEIGLATIPWFPKLLILIFIMAIIPIADFLYAITYGSSKVLSDSIVLVYGFLIQLTAQTLTLGSFTALCLYLDSNTPSWLSSLQKKPMIRECLWGVWVASMAAVLVSFNYYFVFAHFALPMYTDPRGQGAEPSPA